MLRCKKATRMCWILHILFNGHAAAIYCVNTPGFRVLGVNGGVPLKCFDWSASLASSGVVHFPNQKNPHIFVALQGSTTSHKYMWCSNHCAHQTFEPPCGCLRIMQGNKIIIVGRYLLQQRTVSGMGWPVNAGLPFNNAASQSLAGANIRFIPLPPFVGEESQTSPVVIIGAIIRLYALNQLTNTKTLSSIGSSTPEQVFGSWY